jgi:hypothetical protein
MGKRPSRRMCELATSIHVEFDARGDFLGRVAAIKVVHPDLEHDELGMKPIEFPVLETPKKILGPVVLGGEVNGVQRAIPLLPDVVPAAAGPPVTGVLVAIEEKIDRSRPGLVDIILEILEIAVLPIDRVFGIG